MDQKHAFVFLNLDPDKDAKQNFIEHAGEIFDSLQEEGCLRYIKGGQCLIMVLKREKV